MILSFDIEDGISLSLREHFNMDVSLTDRVEIKTVEILDGLLKLDKKATFFVVGEVAKHFPSLIKRIVNEGHDLGSHSYSHKLYTKISDQEIKRELRDSKDILQQVSGVEVTMHRAPQFSISPGNSRVLDMIVESGYTVDSSIVAGSYKGWGWPGFPSGISELKLENGSLIELPIHMYSDFLRIPMIGGTYLKFIPLYILKKIMRVNRNSYKMLYLHPYELDSISKELFVYYKGFFGVNQIKFTLKTLYYWLNRTTVKAKLEYLLESENGNSISSILKTQQIVSRDIQTIY